jgi:hypothetical protein
MQPIRQTLPASAPALADLDTVALEAAAHRGLVDAVGHPPS